MFAVCVLHCFLPCLLEHESDWLGGPFDIEMLKADDLKAGVTKSSWLPIIDYPGFTPAQAKALASQLLSGMLLVISVGALDTSDEWNRLLPDYRFTSAEDFLTKAWHGKL